MNIKALKNQILILSGITIIVFTVLLFTIFSLYQLAFDQHKRRLIETVKNQKLLIESIHQFNSNNNQEGPDGSLRTTLLLIREAHQRFEGLGKTGEFTLAKLQDNQIIFLLSHRHYDMENPESVPINSGIAEPMRRALTDKSGTVVGPDYRNVQVLAAYEPLAIPHWGIVAKIDMSEIRLPYLKAAVFGSLIAIICIIAGTLVFYRTWVIIFRKALNVQNYLALIVENINEAVIERDIDGKITSWSRGAETIFGYGETEVKGKTIAILSPQNNSESASQAFEELMIGQKSDSFEIQCVRKDGGLTDVVLFISPIKDSAGSLIGSSVLVSDISVEKQSELALKHSQEVLFSANQKFELAMRGSSDGFWVWDDMSKNQEWWSPRYYQLLGYQDGEIEASYDNFMKLLHPDDIKSIEIMLSQHLQNNIPFEVEYRLRNKEGVYRWFRGRGEVIRDEFGHPVKMAGSIQDVQDQKETTKINNYLAAIIEDSPDAIIGKDIKGNIVSWNGGQNSCMDIKRMKPLVKVSALSFNGIDNMR